MTTEDDFHAALDAHPDDWQTRLVFADWLQDRDDPRAEGYRALGRLRLYPVRWHAKFFWGDADAAVIREFIANAPAAACKFSTGYLPSAWFQLVGSTRLTKDPFRSSRDDPWERFRVRRRAEDAAALAFAKLPAKRRAELLATAISSV